MITRCEWRWVWFFAGLVMLVTTIPYLVAFAQGSQSGVFSGFLFGVEDGNSYIAKMVRGSAGDWLFRTPYTAYQQQASFTYIPYLLLGKLAALPGLHEQLVVLYHLYRIAAGFFSIAAAYFFIAVFLKQISTRRLALFLLTLGGGLGWLVLIGGKGNFLGSPPLELYSPESFGFLALYGIPHLSLERGFLLCGLAIYLLKAGYNHTWAGSAVLCGGILLAAAALQPLAVLEAFFLIGLHLLFTGLPAWKNRMLFLEQYKAWLLRLKFALVAGVVCAPFLAYLYLVFNLDPILKSWLAQNILTSPHPVHYLLAYGLILPFSAAGAVRFWKSSRRVQSLFLIIWIACLPVLAYAPVTVQRRLPEGIWAAWVVLAAGIFEPGSAPIWKRIKPLLLLTIPSTLLILVMGMRIAIKPASPVFLPAEEAQSYLEFSRAVTVDSVVLASYQTGNQLPAWLPIRVVIGHGPESVRLLELAPRVERFYSGLADAREQQTFLEEFSIDYIFWGPREKLLGSWIPDPGRYKLLIEGLYSIYEVIPPGGE